jgi:hypothetical protein
VPRGRGFEWAIRVDDCALGEWFGIERLKSAHTGGTEQWFAVSFDDGRGADLGLVEQSGSGEGVGQLPCAPDEDVASLGLFQSRVLVHERRSGNDHGGVPQRRVGRLDATTYLVMALTWSPNGLPP